MDQGLEEDLRQSIASYLQPYAETFHRFKVARNGRGLDVRGQLAENDPSDILLLRLRIAPNAPIVEIPNIFMPEFMRGAGVGKQLNALTYEVATRHGHRTLVTDLTPGFYRRLVSRGAAILEPGETVEITRGTSLTQAS